MNMDLLQSEMFPPAAHLRKKTACFISHQRRPPEIKSALAKNVCVAEIQSHFSTLS